MTIRYEAEAAGIDAPLRRRIVWTIRACARRERSYDRDERRLTDPELRTWHAFAGRLHEGDLVSMLVENNAERSPLAERPLAVKLDASVGATLLDESLKSDRHLLTAATATFLEAAAVAFGKPPLDAARRAAFDPIRSADQRILEFPSTAARVASMVAAPGAPLETYVGYVIEDADDAFLVGLAMLEFERNGMPTLLSTTDLELEKSLNCGTFTRGVTLGGEEDLIALVPAQVLPPERIVTL